MDKIYLFVYFFHKLLDLKAEYNQGIIKVVNRFSQTKVHLIPSKKRGFTYVPIIDC